ncbi:MAG TPA: hypothetical protein PKD55_09110 [Bellilinea sp.]|nr:hypothetical protein [Bellilinea sp.]
MENQPFSILVVPYPKAAEPTSPHRFVHFASPPKEAAQGRTEDYLVLYLTFADDHEPEQGTISEMLNKAATVYYNTRGTVTAAMSKVAAELNDRLLARNARIGLEDKPFVGQMTAVAFRQGMSYLAQVGPVHAYIFTKETQKELYNAQSENNGLGLIRNPVVLYQMQMSSIGDVILLAANPPRKWSVETLGACQDMTKYTLRDVLMMHSDTDTQFVLLRVVAGKGQFLLANLEELSNPAPQSRTEQELSLLQRKILNEEPTPTNRGEKLEAMIDSVLHRRNQVVGNVSNVLAGGPKRVLEEIQKMDQPAPEPEVRESIQDASRRLLKDSSALRRDNSAESTQPVLIGAASGYYEQTVSDASRHVLTEETGPVQVRSKPRKHWLLISILVPLLVSALSGFIYIERAQRTQQSQLLTQSQQLMTTAADQVDAALQRINLQSALDLLKQAEELGSSKQTAQMRDEIMLSIDKINAVQHVEMMPVVTREFASNANFQRILTNPTGDLYLLDKANGRVVRLAYVRPSYEYDPNFRCGPGPFGAVSVGSLIDITLAPSGNPLTAVIIGIDNKANLLYCSIHSENNSAITLPKPETGFARISGISFDNNVLHVLDDRLGRIWRYEATALNFTNLPRDFFEGTEISMAGVVSAADNQDDLYILFSDNHLAMCTYNYIPGTPTRCVDPMFFHKEMPGADPLDEYAVGEKLTQIQVTSPPEPSVFLLDTSGHSLFQYSLMMNYVRQIQPLSTEMNPLPTIDPTAAVVTTNRVVVFAYGNKLYSAPLPPID